MARPLKVLLVLLVSMAPRSACLFSQLSTHRPPQPSLGCAGFRGHCPVVTQGPDLLKEMTLRTPAVAFCPVERTRSEVRGTMFLFLQVPSPSSGLKGPRARSAL